MDNKAWKYDDMQARIWVFVDCESTQHNYLSGAKTSRDACEALWKVHGAKHQGHINSLMKFYNYKAKDDECVDKVTAQLGNIQLSIREINEAEAPTNLAVAISLMSAVDEETYHMAIFQLERESNL